MAKRFENDAIDMFVKLLKSKHNVKIIRPRIRLWNSKLKKELPGIPLQPDIDILIYHEEIPELVGVEVKAVYYTGQGKLNRKYYDGLDQSIALHMFGFDKVGFMQLFIIQSKSEKENEKIKQECLNYSRNIKMIIKYLNLYQSNLFGGGSALADRPAFAGFFIYSITNLILHFFA